MNANQGFAAVAEIGEVERVARLLYDAQAQWGHWPDPRWEALIPALREPWKAMARAVVADMAPLADHVRTFLVSPTGAPLCACRNINAVKAGVETPCWYCRARALLVERENGPRHERDGDST